MKPLRRSRLTPETMAVPLSAVIATEELFLRPVRNLPDYEAEARALAGLAEELGNSPEGILQKLVQASLRLCHAHSAGVSLLDEHEGQNVVRWSAIAGEWSAHVGDTTPRHFSPCGVVLDRKSAQLFVRFDRYYPYFRAMTRPTYEALLVPFFVAGEAVGTVWVVSHDETRRFDAEDLRLLSSIAKFAATTFGLLAALDRQRQADRHKDEFLTTLAHELRGPLAPLASSLQVMRAANGDTMMMAQACSIMERQLDQVVRLVDDLLDVDRIRLGKMRLNMDRTEVAAVVQVAVETSRPGIEKRGHDLAIDVPLEPIVVNADAARLAQVFSNLLSNASKYSERKGHIRLTVAQRGPKLVVTVKDDGVGISAQMLPRVFDLFAQEDRSLDKAQGGLGVGLHVAKHLVELHGGSVEARSDGAGLGSEFVVTLPVERAGA
jgi:signal transduction histidine kinase